MILQDNLVMRRRMNINYNKLCLLIIACTVSIVKFINDRMFNTDTSRQDFIISRLVITSI